MNIGWVDGSILDACMDVGCMFIAYPIHPSSTVDNVYKSVLYLKKSALSEGHE